MHRKNLQRRLIFLLAVVFLWTTAFPAWAADHGKHSGKGVSFSVKSNGAAAHEQNKENKKMTRETGNQEANAEKDNHSEKNTHQDQIKDQNRNRERERTRNGESVSAGNGLKLRLEVELAKETEAGLENDELPEKHDRAGLQKLAEKLAAKLDAQPGDVKIMHRLAVYYRNLGDYDRAIELCKEILAADPANQQALVLMALCYRAKGDIAAAIEQLQQLLAEKETVGHSVYAYLGILHEALGNLAQAVESVEKAVYAAGTNQKEYRHKLSELYARANVPGLKIFIRGRKIKPDAPPFIENGRTLVPVRAVAEALGLNVQYFENGTVVITNPANGRTVTIYVGNTEALIGNQKTSLEVAAKIKGGRTFVPLRFVAEGLGAGVDYLADGQIVTVD